ncbi:MAG: hypothetical protein AAEJ52_17110, partial [Myxococcota bacterium]
MTLRRARWLLGIGAVLVLISCSGSDRPAGTLSGPRRPAAEITAQTERQQATRESLADASPSPETQILFGDLHVHTT